MFSLPLVVIVSDTLVFVFYYKFWQQNKTKNKLNWKLVYKVCSNLTFSIKLKQKTKQNDKITYNYELYVYINFKLMMHINCIDQESM